jgi:hypothetical protein
MGIHHAMDPIAYLVLSGLLLVITIAFVVFIFSKRGLATENEFHLTWTSISLSGVILCDAFYSMESDVASEKLVSVVSYFLLGSAAVSYQVFLTRRTRGLVHKFITHVATLCCVLVAGAFFVSATSSLLFSTSSQIPKAVPVISTLIGGCVLAFSDAFFLIVFVYKIYKLWRDTQSNIGEQIAILSIFGSVAMLLHIAALVLYAISTGGSGDPLFFTSRFFYFTGICTLMAMKVIPILLSNRARREKQLQNATETGVVLATAPLSSV